MYYTDSTVRFNLRKFHRVNLHKRNPGDECICDMCHLAWAAEWAAGGPAHELWGECLGIALAAVGLVAATTVQS